MDALPYRVPEADEIIICPYNSSHAIEVKRMPYHLMKCRRQHIGHEYTTCPFNAKHEMPKVELRYHISQCPDKARIAADLDYEKNKNDSRANEFKGCTDVPSYEYDFEMPTSTEDWDSETLEYPRIGINPSILKNANVIRSTVGLTKAEKKDFNQYLFQVHENGEEVPVEPSEPEVVQIERVRTPQINNTFSQGILPSAGVGRGIVMPGVGGGDGIRKPGQNRPAAMLIALARGRPLKHSGLQGSYPQYAASSSSAASSSTESPDDGSGTENGQSMDDLKKRQKKLQKKLRQIQLLEDKQDRGEELTHEEIEKTSKREEIEKALEILNLD